MRFIRSSRFIAAIVVLGISLFATALSFGQTAQTAIDKGSQTARDGFRNEDEIRDKFNAWQSDADAREWLAVLGHDAAAVRSVSAAKPSGDKADVAVNVEMADGTKHRHGISIKLVSSQTGFNQIDKRWLRQYVRMWSMPDDIVKTLRLYLGEDPPTANSRRTDRMFLTEFDAAAQQGIVDFFTANKDRIVADLIRGDGANRATHFMVAWKPGKQQASWKLVTSDEAIKFFAAGKVEITRAGNLKIGRISMQRKGGDGGRDTAKMLQFKLNPAAIFEQK